MSYRILSLNGGGIRGIFQAVCLRELAKGLPSPFYTNFDLIAGTSTGAIVAMGVALGIDLERMVDFFRIEGPKVFSPRVLSQIRQGAHYSRQPLEKALVSALGESRLRDCKRDVLIAAADLNEYRCRAFSTIQLPTLPRRDSDLYAVDVVLASTAAPTYFPPVQPRGEERFYVDGGVWANSPAALAVVHANTYQGIPFHDMKVLTVGNGRISGGAVGEVFQTLRPISPTMITSILDLMFATQSHITDEYTKALVGQGNVLAIDPPLNPPIALDNVGVALAKLPSLAEGVARNKLLEVQAFLTPPRAMDLDPYPEIDTLSTLSRGVSASVSSPTAGPVALPGMTLQASNGAAEAARAPTGQGAALPPDFGDMLATAPQGASPAVASERCPYCGRAPISALGAAHMPALDTLIPQAASEVASAISGQGAALPLLLPGPGEVPAAAHLAAGQVAESGRCPHCGQG